MTGVALETQAVAPFTLFLLLRAFSSGAVAVTDTEAVSNGITAFREPKSRNAAATLAWMSILIGTMFIGTTILANHAGALPGGNETVISQLARAIYGRGGLHLVTLAATTIILILAANTAFADFPQRRVPRPSTGTGGHPRRGSGNRESPDADRPGAPQACRHRPGPLNPGVTQVSQPSSVTESCSMT